MKIFVPFEETLLDDMLPVGEALVPFQLHFERGRVAWEQVEVLDESAPAATGNFSGALATVE